MLISFVIPVYNAKGYLSACVESCLHLAQSAQLDAEIVLVDDGSTDGSGALCDDWQETAVCKVIHQQNQGVSAARNAGLKVATGRWIWFVDADDTIVFQPEWKERLSDIAAEIREAKTTNFVITGFVWEEEGVAKEFGARPEEVPYNLWRCWFRRDLIEEQKLRFTEGRKYAEDQEFLLQYLLHLQERQAQCINVPLYHYTMRPGSAMTRKGVRGKMCRDMTAVLFRFLWVAVRTGKCGQRWVGHETRRMSRTLLKQLTGR